MRAGILALSLSMFAAACTSGEPVDRSAEAPASPSPGVAIQGLGLLVVKRVREPGPFPTEGSVSSVTVRPARGPFLRGLLGDVEGGERLVRLVPNGPFTISHAERPCDGSCGALDPPINRCAAQHRMTADMRIVLTIAVSYEGCELRFSADGPIKRRVRDPRVFARLGETYEFQIRSHCGIGHPIEFDGRFWVPEEARYRRSFNAPRGFDFNTDVGTMTLVDSDTASYLSSGGTTVLFEPFDGVVKLFVCY